MSDDVNRSSWISEIIWHFCQHRTWRNLRESHITYLVRMDIQAVMGYDPFARDRLYDLIFEAIEDEETFIPSDS